MRRPRSAPYQKKLASFDNRHHFNNSHHHIMNTTKNAQALIQQILRQRAAEMHQRTLCTVNFHQSRFSHHPPCSRVSNQSSFAPHSKRSVHKFQIKSTTKSPKCQEASSPPVSTSIDSPPPMDFSSLDRPSAPHNTNDFLLSLREREDDMVSATDSDSLNDDDGGDDAEFESFLGSSYML